MIAARTAVKDLLISFVRDLDGMTTSYYRSLNQFDVPAVGQDSIFHERV
jgi:hypothetical protein